MYKHFQTNKQKQNNSFLIIILEKTIWFFEMFSKDI